MPLKLRLVPLFNTQNLLQGEIVLGRDFSIRNIKGLLTSDCFNSWKRQLSKDELSEFLTWDLCLVHEFSSDLSVGPDEQRSELLTRLMVASFRWLHPTETADYWYVQGVSIDGGPLRIHQFTHRQNLHIFLEDYEARTGLATPEEFGQATAFLPYFERIVESIGEKTFAFNPIVVAMRLSEQAYLDFDPKLRFLKRMMALEALFSTEETYGKRALLPHLPKFIGGHTPIYPSSAASYTVDGVLRDMCDLRNAFAHGDVVPIKFLGTPPQPDVLSTNVKSYADVLREASAMIVRSVFLRIFRENLTDIFADKKKMIAYLKS